MTTTAARGPSTGSSAGTGSPPLPVAVTVTIAFTSCASRGRCAFW